MDNDCNDQDLVSAVYVTEGPTALARHGQSGRKGGATVRRVALLVLGLACVVAIAVAAHPAPRNPIYSVDQVYGGLWAYPSAWVGRTVRVRGIEVSTRDYRGNMWGQLLSTTWRPGMQADDVPNLVIAPQPPDPWLARLRRLPLPAVIEHFLPQQQVPPHNGQPAVYRLLLVRDPDFCASQPSPCPTAFVVDGQAQGW